MTTLSTTERSSTVLERVVDMHPRRVHVHEDLTPVAARERNLRLVCEALDTAGVAWFLVPGMRDEGSAVGVREEERGAVLQALERLFQREPGYVSTCVPQPRQRVQPMPGDDRAAWHRHGQGLVLQLTWFRGEPTGSMVLSTATSCDVEFWSE